eukprot:83012-Chlamydomonas_euryale.AAC.4
MGEEVWVKKYGGRDKSGEWNSTVAGGSQVCACSVCSDLRYRIPSPTRPHRPPSGPHGSPWGRPCRCRCASGGTAPPDRMAERWSRTPTPR